MGRRGLLNSGHDAVKSWLAICYQSDFGMEPICVHSLLLSSKGHVYLEEFPRSWGEKCSVEGTDMM
jgi:hypothetical protein